jgi:hypothetical protein
MIFRIKKFIPFVSGIIVFIATAFIGQMFLQKVSAAVTPTATLTLSASSLNPQVNQNLTVGIGLNSASNIVGVDAIVYFDSRYLDVVSASLGTTGLKTLVPGSNNTLDLTKAVTLNTTDPSKSTVEIGLVAFDQSNNQLTTPITGNFDAATNPIAQIVFKGKAMGTSSLSFRFDSNGTTTDSNVVTNDNGNPQDILTAPQSTLNIGVILACATIDINSSGSITISDIQSVSSRWGSATGDPTYDVKYDLDVNGTISIKDIQLVSSRWGEQCL